MPARFICLVLLVCGLTVTAREIAVAPGTSLATALDAAKPGDTVRLAKGLYREHVRIGSGVTLTGDAGAVIDPSEPLAVAWKPAKEIGEGVFRAAFERKPSVLFVDGKVLAELDERRTGGDGDWSWRKLIASGPPRSGFTHIRAFWMFRASEKTVYAHFENGADPAGLALSVTWSRDPVVSFAGATNAVLREVMIAGGFTGVALTDGARGCRIEQCVVGPWEKYGVLLTGGASDCRVASNEVFRGAFEHWAPRENSKERYEIWQIHKNAGFYDRIGVNLFRAGADNRVLGNRIRETFDGICLGDSAVESLDKPLTRPDDGKGTEIAYNTIEDTRDSGIELGVGCIDVRVHHNELRRTHGGLRFKVPRIGPVFIFRNVLLDGSPFNVWFSMDDAPAEGWFYHNTIVGSRLGLQYSSFETPHLQGTPNWHFLNNLIVTEKGFFQKKDKDKTPVNFAADYNVVVGGSRPWPEAEGREPHSRYVNDAKLETRDPPRPAKDSPVVDAGLDLSTAHRGGPLPGCEPGAFKGRAPDAGAFEVE